MREERLIAKAAKLYRRKALPTNPCITVDNLRYNIPPPSAPNQQWAGDVSYLKVHGEWIYLSVILDLYSRKVIGWSLGKNRTTDLTLKSLDMAVKSRKFEPGLIFHSDKGSEESLPNKVDAYLNQKVGNTCERFLPFRHADV